MAATQRGGFLTSRTLLIAIPYLWLIVFFALPFVLVVKISLSDVDLAQPPYTPLFNFDWTWQSIVDFVSQLDFENYTLLMEDPLYWKAYVSSLQIAAISTVLLLIVGYPIAYGMARAPRTWRQTLLMLVILPFWTSFLIRVYAWIGILKPEGLLNLALSKIGLIDMANPLQILNTDLAVY